MPLHHDGSTRGLPYAIPRLSKIGTRWRGSAASQGSILLAFENAARAGLPFLKPDESRTYDLTFEILTEAERLATVLAWVPMMGNTVMPKRVVILGAGFGGMNVARRLERLARTDEVVLTIVNRENYMLFTPMLPEVASGSVEPRHIAPPVRAIVRKCSFELGDITGVDFKTRTVTLRRLRGEGVANLPFDHLVIALGAESSTHGVPGAQEHTFPLKTLEDAVSLRDVTITALENAATSSDDDERHALTTFGELLAFLRAAARFYPRIDGKDIRVVLIAGSDRLLEQLPASLGTLAERMLGRRGVEVVLGDQVASVDAGGISLRSGKRYETRCVAWSAGVRPSPLAAGLALAHSEHHAIVVNADFSVRGTTGVWALGDCAQVPKPNGGSYPQTAQHAVHEAGLLARNLLATLRGGKTKPYTYRTVGMMASLGAHEGLAEIGGRWTIAGLAGWLLWRTYYLWQLPGNDRKARVVLDWSLDLPFPQDIASVR